MFYFEFYLVVILVVNLHLVLSEGSSSHSPPDGMIQMMNNTITSTETQSSTEAYEPVNQDNGISYLCLDEKMMKGDLIICDERNWSLLACVAADHGIDGHIKPCKKFIPYKTAIPLCLKVNSSQIVTCKYRNIYSANICYPKTNSTVLSNEPFINSENSSQVPFRICNYDTRFSCLKNGKASPCDPDSNKGARQSKNGKGTKDNLKHRKSHKKYPGQNNKNHKKHSHKTHKESSLSKYQKHQNGKYSKKHNDYYNKSNKKHHKKSHSTHKHNSKSSSKKINNMGYKAMRDEKVYAERNQDREDYHRARKENSATDIPIATAGNKYFHVIKCEDCTIDHLIKVKEDAYSIKVWTLPSDE